MADYCSDALWEVAESESVGNIDPSSLDISDGLVAELALWSDAFTATLDQDDPLASGFVDEPSAKTWLDQGAGLAARLRGEGFTVEYVHDGEAPRDLVARTA